VGRIIGIDLGTTNSCVSVTDDRGQPKIIATPDGERTIPSVVAFADGKPLVGIKARRQAVTNPDNTVFGAKRLIGRKVNQEEVALFVRSSPLRIVAAPNGDAWLKVGGEGKSPQEISSLVLQRIREVAEEVLNEPITRAVVTVPAYFDEPQRQATKDAGTIAGMEIVRLLNEPTAAALAFGAHRVRKGRRLIAVFDLGGGTFDVSIMAVEDGIFEVMATHGDMALGGDDWDRRIIEQLADEIFDQHRFDVTTSPMTLGRLKEAAEQAKIALSTTEETVIRLPYLGQSATGEPIHVERTLTREQLDALTGDLAEALREPCETAMREAGVDKEDIEEVLLCGGMTRTQSVQVTVEDIFGRKPSKRANPDEVVALGAAAYAAILAGDFDDAALLDVTPRDIGIKVGESGFTTLIPRNSMLPVRTKKLFATTRDDQKFVHIEVYQGESGDIHQNRKLGHITLDRLPPGKAGTIKVELSITIDVESILNVGARELSTGKETRVRIRPTGGLSERELIAIIERRRVEEQTQTES